MRPPCLDGISRPTKGPRKANPAMSKQHPNNTPEPGTRAKLKDSFIRGAGLQAGMFATVASLGLAAKGVGALRRKLDAFKARKAVEWARENTKREGSR